MKFKLLFVLIFLFSTCLISQEDAIYVWDFSDRDGQTSDMTVNLTDEFEEALIRTECCKVLQRRNYSRLFSQRENENAVSGFINMPKEFQDRLNDLSASMVAFGEVYDDTNSGQYKISVSIEDFSGQILKSASTYMAKFDVTNPAKREYAISELMDELKFGSTSKEPVETKNVDEWVFSLTGCKRIGKDVQCGFEVTSNYRDRNFIIQNTTAFDEYNYEYRIASCQLANKSGYSSVQSLLIDGVKAYGFIRFKNISSRALKFSLLNFYVTADDLSTNTFEFRNVEFK